jgi:type I restriction enzyme M protein
LARKSWARPTQTRNDKLCTIIQKIAEGLAEFSTDSDTLGDAYEYLIGQFAAGSGKKAGEFYTPQRISDILSAIVTLDSQEPEDRQAEEAGQRDGLCLRLGLSAA